jgi:hypothetical protein
MIEHRQEPATIVGELISFGGVVWGMTAWLIFYVLVELCVGNSLIFLRTSYRLLSRGTRCDTSPEECVCKRACNGNGKVSKTRKILRMGRYTKDFYLYLVILTT